MEFPDKNRKKSKNIEDNLLHEKKDRRLLPDVPSATGRRQKTDRRGSLDNDESFEAQRKRRQIGIRYLDDFLVQVKADKARFFAHSIDVSLSGMAILVSEEEKDKLERAKKVHLKFHVDPGTMPEGFEMNVNTQAKVVRSAATADGMFQIGLQYAEDLSEHARKRKDR